MEIEQYLDAQREKLIPEYEYLKSLVENFQSLIKDFADFLNSEEGQRQFSLCFLQQSSLVLSLLDVAAQKSRSDGWMCLSSASHEIQKILPGELAQLSSKWGYKKLKDLMLASDFFELFEEPTEKGGVRLLYRLKEQNELPQTTPQDKARLN